MVSTQTDIRPTRPVLRYHGGKWLLAEWIISHFPRHRVYTEAFGGAASVLIRKPRAYAEVYNDLDGEIVNLFRVLRDPAQARELRRQIEFTPFARAEFDVAYTPAADPIEIARRTLIRSFMGFGSAAFNSAHATGFRDYTKGERGRQPYKDWANWPAQIEAFTARLRGVIIESRPAAAVIQKHDDVDALHYVDPPYPLSTRGSASGVRQKYRFEMSDDEHRELAGALKGLRGAVVLSGYPSDLYDRELFADWHRREKPTHADGANPRTEVLWLNEAAHRALEAQGLQPSMFGAISA